MGGSSARNGISLGHPDCWGPVDCCPAGAHAHRVISQIVFMISFTSKAKTTRTVWKFALKWAPAGWHRVNYKTFDPSATTAEALHWGTPFWSRPACSASSHLCGRKQHQPSAMPAPLHRDAVLCCRRGSLAGTSMQPDVYAGSPIVLGPVIGDIKGRRHCLHSPTWPRATAPRVDFLFFWGEGNEGGSRKINCRTFCFD